MKKYQEKEVLRLSDNLKDQEEVVFQLSDNLKDQEKEILRQQNKNQGHLGKPHRKHNLSQVSIDGNPFIPSNDEMHCSDFEKQRIERDISRPSPYFKVSRTTTETLDLVATKLKAIEQEQSNINLNNK